ncbi:hypothetical protein [Streptomyces sp. R41]|uniref:Bacterial bifunctional deaminase-reductase C-terminal domain-containing protein n=1 Tax=Streptomyces sp. R41 TaxID=3238632 RepID=A0AB39RUL0_9ACTN
MTHVILDGTLIESGRLAGVRGNGDDLWSSIGHGLHGQRRDLLETQSG